MMHGTPTKKTHHPHTGVRWPYSPERFPHTAGGKIFARGMAGITALNRSCRRLRDRCPYMAKPLKMVRRSP